MATKFLFVCVLICTIRGSLQDHPSGQVTQFHSHDKNHDGCLEKNEFKSIFLGMDTNHDEKLSISEVYHGWHNLNFPDYHDASFFFMEMDRDRDTYITSTDLTFLFATFNPSNLACISMAEYTQAWNSFFKE